MENSWINSFAGHHVTIFTVNGTVEKTDTGTLVQIGDGWLQLSKDNGEVLMIPYTAVRAMKMLDISKTIPTPNLDRATISNHIYEPNAQTL